MAKSASRKGVVPDTRGAREILLDTAERLLAEHGIDGISLRQIAIESGQGNNSVIQYHFGDKTGLLREIILRRVAGFEPRRQALLAAAESGGRLSDVRTLLEILFLPIAELVDGRGRHVYARFIMQFLSSFRYQVGIDHPGWAPDSAASRAAMLMPDCLPLVDRMALHARITRVGGVFFNALIERDNAAESGRSAEAEAIFLDDLFGMMTAAISVPYPVHPLGMPVRLP
jgi:AcrR family transcriptional regulator